MTKLAQLQNSERANLFARFNNEVCKKYCRLCSGKTPNFCIPIFIEIGQLYFDKILFLIDTARQKRPALYDDLDTLEGFVALFCDARVCPFFGNSCNDISKKVKCYCTFLAQSHVDCACDEMDLISLYDPYLVNDICDGLNDMNKINSRTSNKYQKRRRKMANKFIKMTYKWSKNITNRANTGYRTVINVKKKSVTTQFFCGGSEIFKQRIKTILEGNSQCE